jgi:NAD(P)-dependent dehydrogenase (short-subunit alcohol dehydrogenase family)
MGLLDDEMRSKVVIITGGTKGVGKGIARVFCGAFSNVVICGRDEKDGRQAESELNSLNGGSCSYYECDLSEESQIRSLMQYTVKKYSKIDCLINNAAYQPDRKKIDQVEVGEVEKTMKVNFTSLFSGCKYALPFLRQSKGSIINISSILSKSGQAEVLAYAASKGAINAFTKSLAIEEAENGVRINTVISGNIITEKNHPAPDSKASKYSYDHAQIMGRAGTPEEIGKVCIFLASSYASYMTGTEIVATGGYELTNGIKFSTLEQRRKACEILAAQENH